MKRSKQKTTFGFGKTFVVAAFTVCAVTLVFQGLTQAALAAELGRSETVSANYPEHIPDSSRTGTQKLPEGYTKPAYTLVDSSLEYYRDQKPSAAQLSREEAAELGVQGLYTVFGLDMDGKEIEMAFNPAKDGYRAVWNGTWWPNGPKTSLEAYVASYSFTVDAVTGELHSVDNNRVLDGRADTGFHAGLERNAAEYEALARELSVNLGAVQSAVQSVEYDGQGYSNNDPDIFFRVTGKGGERAQLRFSRHDQALLAVIYDRGMREMDVSIQAAEEFAKRAEEYFRNNPDAATYSE